MGMVLSLAVMHRNAVLATLISVDKQDWVLASAAFSPETHPCLDAIENLLMKRVEEICISYHYA